MEHHADFAVPVAQRLSVETDYDRPGDATGKVAGRAIALGWWVDKPGDAPTSEPTGVLYLVVDETLPRPVWVAQGRLTAVRLDD